MDLYVDASKIILAVLNKTGSIKTLVYKSQYQNKKSLYAIVCEVIKHRQQLENVGRKCENFGKDKRLAGQPHPFLLHVLLFEHILGKGVRGKFKALVERHKNSIHVACERLKVKAGVDSVKQLFSQSCSDTGSSGELPKYVRVNTIKISMADVEKELGKTFTFISRPNIGFSDIPSLLTPHTVLRDPHIPNLLVFHPRTDLHSHRLYKTGAIILQDKASCTPAHVLSPPPGSTVIDCCAAPGNKTTHLAAIMGNTGKVFAFDKDKKRVEILKKMVTTAGATCVTPVFKDFLSVDPTDSSYARVEYILVDPSCSGSGMVNRVSMKSDEDSYPKERLNQLSKFQISILKHALSFPNVKKIVYSTCSIHEEENEQVVEEVYSHVSEIFEIDHVMPDWPMRGLVTYEHGEKCVRMSHDLTLTNGFFVSSFSRKINKKRKHEEDGCHSEKNRPLKVKVKNTRSSKVVHKSNVRKQQGPSIETHKHLRATTDWKIDIIAV
ncbi:28S rRNA (cytosine-C(5))-methyltransferase-like [Mya arenaria]|uniref:28S rRNA (cytosine-C(5))-methyltransferase-like n=1 Tax=Mya arenaria TaxID=6604 RepID=UPI0022DEF88B|nr:28S rRNA (cytosine-C(5))-methyltransferase-like [Mya arenaria]